MLKDAKWEFYSGKDMQVGIDIQGLVRHRESLQKAFEYGSAFRQEDLEAGINLWVEKKGTKSDLEKLRQRRAMWKWCMLSILNSRGPGKTSARNISWHSPKK